MGSGYCFLLSLLSFATLALSTRVFRHPGDLPSVDYDFIIVGGGTAGAVVASRLGEIPDYKILVIEAGLSDDDVFDVRVPGLSLNTGEGTIVDWNYTAAPQPNLDNREIPYSRAKILGGCSSHNEMVYTRGSRDDYDRWASSTGDVNLSWDKIFSYILKTEKWSAPNDPGLSEEGHFDPSLHSETGKLGVTAPYFNHPFNDLLFEATSELSDEFPLLKDPNNGRPIGLAWGHATIAHGFRSSSASAFLAPASDNIHVLLQSLVTRVLPIDKDENDSNGQSLQFRKIELVTSPEGPTTTLTAKREVIISAGVINTPQLLLLSGVGPRKELETLGIKSFIDNPSVGKNFSDQAAIIVGFSTNLPATDSFNQTEALAQWKLNHTGPFALAQHMPPFGWVRFPPDSEPFKDGAVDPSGGTNSPHVEFYFGAIVVFPAEGNLTLGMQVVDLNPESRGAITLASSSPFDQPIIDLGLLTSPLDTAILLEGFRSAERLFASETFSKNVLGPIAPAPSSDGTVTDDDFIQYLKTNASHFGHGVGSCGMAPRGGGWGVVDSEFRVLGAKGLRIVDASVIPFVPSGHTQAPIYALAERASDLIKISHRVDAGHP